jgi:hypothetical protein
MKEKNEFEYGHLPLRDLSIEQHIEAATEFFREVMKMDPSGGLQHAKETHLYTLRQCPLSDEDRRTIIDRAAKAALGMESH